MNQILSDLRFGLRMLIKTPGASGMVIIALALGIGLSALTFSLITGAVLPVLPSEGGERITRIDRAEREPTTSADYAAWVERQRSFETLGASTRMTATLAIEGSGAEPVSTAAITPSIFEVLSTEPALGRRFTGQDATGGAPAVVLLGHSVWIDRLGGASDALGRIVRIDGRPAEVVGVMPEGFGFPYDQQMWVPLPAQVMERTAVDSAEPSQQVAVVGRLREGIAPETAAAELSAITREVDSSAGGETSGPVVRVRNYTDLFEEGGQATLLSALLLGVALLVLVVACTNVANVLLARAIERAREIAVRLAIGASRWRIFRQLLLEMSVLAAIGAAGGIVLVVLGTGLVNGLTPPGMPYWVSIEVDGAVIGFVAATAVLSTLVAGIIPALQASRSNTNELLKDTSRGGSSFRLGRVMRRLIAVEMALSFVLLVLAGLFVRSAANFRTTDFAFEPEEVYTAQIRLPETGYADPAARVRFTDELQRVVSDLPTASEVALATAVPGVGAGRAAYVFPEGAAPLPGDEGSRTGSVLVSSGFFELFRTQVLRGRDFDERDPAGALPVAIVNEEFARRHYPDGALERRFRMAAEEAGDEIWYTIIGIAPDLLASGVEGEIRDAIYLPVNQNPPSELRLIVRPRAGFATVAAGIRESVAALDPNVALFNVLPHDVMIARANSQYTWFSLVFLVSGGIALFLASLGLYGVMAFWVIQRTREIGVRMALGGREGDIVRLVTGQGMRQSSVGLIAGVVLAIPAAVLLRSALFGVDPYDPLVFGAITAVLLGAAWLGCWVPARRATRMNPLDALAGE